MLCSTTEGFTLVGSETTIEVLALADHAFTLVYHIEWRNLDSSRLSM